MTRIPPIDSVEHIRQLRGRDTNYAVRRRWPDEAAFLQSFGVERHAETVMPKDLDQVTSSASKDVKITCVGIAPQRFLDLQSQAIHATPHVRSSNRQPDPHTGGDWDHRRRSRMLSTRPKASASKSRSTRTRQPFPSSMTIKPGPFDALAEPAGAS